MKLPTLRPVRLLRLLAWPLMFYGAGFVLFGFYWLQLNGFFG
jgi:hypothetical protein